MPDDLGNLSEAEVKALRRKIAERAKRVRKELYDNAAIGGGRPMIVRNMAEGE
ncbi:MAG: hypothetical protein G01um101425_729 [Candidatus Peregrinibacteria bacterium Gr01-1014_25]|nr:MAG: hypothetical protein G01um101425_729 [Candidatus Peregrinibacteria bacterium Gr01-1014_25]